LILVESQQTSWHSSPLHFTRTVPGPLDGNVSMLEPIIFVRSSIDARSQSVRLRNRRDARHIRNSAVATRDGFAVKMGNKAFD
jgi:hypothetical protein